MISSNINYNERLFNSLLKVWYFNLLQISGCRSPSDNQKPDYDPHWSNPSSPPDSGVPPLHTHQKRTEEGYITSARNRGKYCASCSVS